MIELVKTISFCAIPLEINHWNVHCVTPVKTNQKKVRRKYNDRKEHKESNLEEQNFDEQVLKKMWIIIF